MQYFLIASNVRIGERIILMVQDKNGKVIDFFKIDKGLTMAINLLKREHPNAMPADPFHRFIDRETYWDYIASIFNHNISKGN